MVNVQHIGDDVLCNILARLPAKPLMRFRCVAKHWNRLISDPYFMKSRSRRMILFPFLRPLMVVDDNVPAEDVAHSMVRIRSPSELKEGATISIIGTFNGVVLLALIQKWTFRCQLILYNPLTSASKLLLVTDPPSFCDIRFCDHFAFGFGYGHGETTHDLKIVRFERIGGQYKCDVFDLKTSSWSTSPQYIKNDFSFSCEAGVFVNGFLYWATRRPCLTILALNVKKMVISKITLPSRVKQTMLLLGSIDGCLCVINSFCWNKFHVWLMKEECDENSWMKTHSFSFTDEVENMDQYPHQTKFTYCPISILSNGKILFTSTTVRLIIYDTSNDSHKMLNCLDSKLSCGVLTFYSLMGKTYEFSRNFNCMEYVESVVSPSDVCFI